jgi:methionine synthase II (cobalamin-independent)
MTAPISRRALQLLPPCATTGIGSLPHSQLELALQMAFQVDIPYLPQLPAGNASEFMIPAALDGLPGVRFDGEGLCSIDIDEWQRQREAFGASIETALSSGDLTMFEPSPQASRAWKPFLWEIQNRKLAFAKVQIAGPATVRWATKTSVGDIASDVPDLDQQIFRLLLAKCLAMAKAVRRASATAIVYLDEPGLYALDRTNAQHLVALQEFKVLAMALQREGALVGLHCCGNTDWDLVLDEGVDLLSLDVRLSLDAVLEERRALDRFLASGAALSLGIVPTNVAASFSVQELVDSVETSLSATLGRKRALEVMLRSLLTPACGLAMRSVVVAEQTFEQLRQAQRLLKRAMEPDLGPPEPIRPAPN